MHDALAFAPSEHQPSFSSLIGTEHFMDFDKFTQRFEGEPPKWMSQKQETTSQKFVNWLRQVVGLMMWAFWLLFGISIILAVLGSAR